MFRIRAVESPPDDSGIRKVWHRGAKYAELVSEIDREGRVARHELSLFDDVLVWERGRGFQTGETLVDGSTRGAAKVSFDLTTSPERIERVARALQPYAGRDRIIEHLKGLVSETQQGRQPTRDLGVVTGNHRVVDDAAVQAHLARQAPPARKPNLALLAVGVGLMVIAVALAIIVLR
ncbi:MAG: hypothetical protein ACOZQL_12440 [Myxococcota bacterium]